VAFAAATEETRPVLQGVQLRLRDNRAIFAAADGFRLAQRIIELPEPIVQQQELIIPARALTELARIVDDDESPVEMMITPGGGQVLFHTSTVDLVSRLIEGRFPDVDRVYPTAVSDTRRARPPGVDQSPSNWHPSSPSLPQNIVRAAHGTGRRDGTRTDHH
jgi:DNA polymerase III sliding clamp (beta) subunit (PCNA family)